MSLGRVPRRLLPGLASGLILVTATAATAWPVAAAGGGRALAAATGLPAAPTGVAASCSLISLQVTVAWNAVPHATTYTVWQSVAGSSGPYTAVATVASTTWTSPVLIVGTYWYEVTATVGGSWTSPASAPTAPRTITVALCT